MTDWVGSLAWTLRSPQLGDLCVRDSGKHAFVAITTTVSIDEPAGRLWMRLGRSPTILDPAGFDDRRNLLLRYAAIDWGHRPLALEAEGVAVRVATWGIDLTWALEMVTRNLSVHERGPFACPTVFIDLDSRVRIGFFSSVPVACAPEVVAAWPTCFAPGLVFAVGRALSVLLASSSESHPLHVLVQRCLQPDPTHRFQSLGELRTSLTALGGRTATAPTANAATGAMHLEQGIGFFQLAEFAKARSCFIRALGVSPELRLARSFLRATEGRIDELAATTRRGLVWGEIAPRVAEREAQRDFRGALLLLRDASATGAERRELDLAIARCCRANDELGDSLRYARRVLDDDPASVAAHDIQSNALLALRRHADALLAAESWLTANPDDGRAHHARAKALIALGRPADARASFDRASQLSPDLVAAAMLRTNLDRSAKELRAHVGVESPRRLDVPAHLAELAPMIAADRIADAIAWLATRIADPLAHRFLATCHEYLGDHRAALAVYDALGDAIGAGRCLVALDRLSEALVVLGELADPEALDLRAHALDRLGRTEEAARIRARIAWESVGSPA